MLSTLLLLAGSQAASAADKTKPGHPTANSTAVDDNATEQLDAELASIGKRGAELIATDPDRKTSAHAQEKKEVLIIGSSSVRGMMGRTFVRNLVRAGYDAKRIGKSASGLARLDYHDWISLVSTLPISERTVAIIVYVGVNDPQGIWLRPSERVKPSAKWHRWHKPGWSDRYRDRVVELINALCIRGVPNVVFVTPVDVRWPSLQRRLRRIRRLQIEGSRDSACGHVVSGSGDKLFIEDRIEKRRPRRLRDGYHMTYYGAQLLYDRISRRLHRLLQNRRTLVHSVPAPVPDLSVSSQSDRSGPRPGQ